MNMPLKYKESSGRGLTADDGIRASIQSETANPDLGGDKIIMVNGTPRLAKLAIGAAMKEAKEYENLLDTEYK